jgi:hypothetical protein
MQYNRGTCCSSSAVKALSRLDDELKSPSRMSFNNFTRLSYTSETAPVNTTTLISYYESIPYCQKRKDLRLIIELHLYGDWVATEMCFCKASRPWGYTNLKMIYTLLISNNKRRHSRRTWPCLQTPYPLIAMMIALLVASLGWFSFSRCPHPTADSLCPHANLLSSVHVNFHLSHLQIALVLHG